MRNLGLMGLFRDIVAIEAARASVVNIEGGVGARQTTRLPDPTGFRPGLFRGKPVTDAKACARRARQRIAKGV